MAERDAFDTLFDHAPDKLNLVKKVNTPTPRPSPHCHHSWDMCRLFLDSLQTQGRLRWDERCLEFLRFALYVETILSNVWHGVALLQ